MTLSALWYLNTSAFETILRPSSLTSPRNKSRSSLSSLCSFSALRIASSESPGRRRKNSLSMILFASSETTSHRYSATVVLFAKSESDGKKFGAQDASEAYFFNKSRNGFHSVTSSHSFSSKG